MSRGKHRRPKTNPLTRGAVVAGTSTAALALPLLSGTAASAAEPAQAPATAKVAPQLRTVHYTVAKGDTLVGIAHAYDAQGGWRGVYQDNRKAIGDNPGLIHSGLKLTIKTTKAAKATAGQAGSAAKSSSSVAHATTASLKTYPDNLDGWIHQSLDIMAQHGIPGSYDGIYRNIMRESSGNPAAINLWDSNAAAGTPSKGLLQVIDPTFLAYHVSGTSMDPYDPVANITAACNYAAARYGSIDNVFSAY